MKLSEFYRMGIEVGKTYDPRHNGSVEKWLANVRRVYDSLDEGQQAAFDRDSLWNPYLDSRVVCGDEEGRDPDFKKVMVTLEQPPVVVVMDYKPDLLLSHHPEGRACTGLHQVLYMQVGIWKRHGVKIDAIDDFAVENSLRRLYELAARDLREGDLGEITEDWTDIYRYFGKPWIIMHTAADNCATTYLQHLVDSKTPESLADVVTLLNEIPEYRQGNAELIGPRIVTGRPKNKAGKIVVDMTGGYQGPEEIFTSFADSGIRTILCMHVTRSWYDAAADHHVQIVCAGHAPSDNLGMNLLIDDAMPEDVEIYPRMGGFRRFSHRDEDQSWKESARKT